jgi:hypothetical protein
LLLVLVSALSLPHGTSFTLLLSALSHTFHFLIEHVPQSWLWAAAVADLLVGIAVIPYSLTLEVMSPIPSSLRLFATSPPEA